MTLTPEGKALAKEKRRQWMKEYNRRYYQEHREQILQQRKKRDLMGLRYKPSREQCRIYYLRSVLKKKGLNYAS